MGIARDFDLGALGRRRPRARAGRGDEARLRRRVPLHRRRAAAGRLPGRALPRDRAARWSTSRGPAIPGPATCRGRHRLPDGRRPRPHGVLVHPEHLHRLRLARRGAGHGRDAAEPRRVLHARGGAPEPAGARSKRPFHTIIPGMLLDEPASADRPVRPDGRPRPAAGAPAADHEPPLPRARPAGRAGRPALAPRPGRRRLAAVPRARACGTSPTTWSAAATAIWRDGDRPRYGGGQAIMLRGDELVGGSEPRKDGLAAGY